jgi:hypothetical protein
MLQRKPIQRKTELKRGGPLKRTGFLKRSEWRPTRKKPDIPANVRRQVKDRSGGICELRLPDICWGRATQMDHIKNRSQGAGHLVDGLQHACLPCHEWKTTHPDAAHELGIYRRAWE